MTSPTPRAAMQMALEAQRQKILAQIDHCAALAYAAGHHFAEHGKHAPSSVMSKADADTTLVRLIDEYAALRASLALPAEGAEPTDETLITASRWSNLSDAEVLRIAPIAMLSVTQEEREGFCAGFRRCAQALAATPHPPQGRREGDDCGKTASQLYECAECSQPDCGWTGECDGESCPQCGGHVVPVPAGVEGLQEGETRGSIFGEVVVTRNAAGAIVLVSRQDHEGRILRVIAEAGKWGVRKLGVGMSAGECIVFDTKEEAEQQAADYGGDVVPLTYENGRWTAAAYGVGGNQQQTFRPQPPLPPEPDQITKGDA